jgi:hypothetical protein
MEKEKKKINKRFLIQTKIVKRLSQDLQYYKNELSKLRSSLNDLNDDYYESRKKNDLLHENYIVLNETKTSFIRELDNLKKMLEKNIIILDKNNIINAEKILELNTPENAVTNIIL